MKRCPSCEFIYEDEQRLCDMDGSELTLDPRPLPKLQALNETGSSASTRRNWKGHRVPVFASVSLIGVLLFVYYFSFHQSIPPTRQTLVPASSQSLSSGSHGLASGEPAPPKTEGTNPAPKFETIAVGTSPENESAGRKNIGSDNKQQRHEPARSATERSVHASTVKTRGPVESETKDSKVGSMLKKTGEFLKRPFKH